jgi:hypothetical protein
VLILISLAALDAQEAVYVVPPLTPVRLWSRKQVVVPTQATLTVSAKVITISPLAGSGFVPVTETSIKIFMFRTMPEMSYPQLGVYVTDRIGDGVVSGPFV